MTCVVHTKRALVAATVTFSRSHALGRARMGVSRCLDLLELCGVRIPERGMLLTPVHHVNRVLEVVPWVEPYENRLRIHRQRVIDQRQVLDGAIAADAHVVGAKACPRFDPLRPGVIAGDTGAVGLGITDGDDLCGLVAAGVPESGPVVVGQLPRATVVTGSESACTAQRLFCCDVCQGAEGSAGSQLGQEPLVVRHPILPVAVVETEGHER